MRYRTDIDGLRAVAVLVVILFHFDVPGFTGGFVGVDVFFVISGFLITGIIHRELRVGRFSLARFYERRVRRILPALLAVVVLTACAAPFVLHQSQLAELAASVVATATFASNIFFWLRSDYFSVASEFKPLLHTWSLAVEEQFYIAFPLVMLALRRLNTHQLAATLTAIAVASFGLCLIVQAFSPGAAFYLPFPRAWELMVGAVLALGVIEPPRHRRMGEALSLVGLGLIAASTVMLDGSSTFPGVGALAPVFGTALVLYGGATDGGPVSGFLARPTMRYLGHISYSLYLWHWPVAAFVRSSVWGELTVWHQVLMFVLTALLSVASYHLVEDPLRHGAGLPRRRILQLGVASLVALIAVGGAVHFVSESTEYRRERVHERSARAHLAEVRSCFLEGSEHDPRCDFGERDARRRFVLWGDSHAANLLPVFEEHARAAGWRGTLVGAEGCAPLRGVWKADARGVRRATCDGETAERLFAWLDEEPVDAVVLVARFTMFERGWLLQGRLHEDDPGFLSDRQAHGADAATSAAVLARGLTRTVAELNARGIRPIVLAPLPVLPDRAVTFATGTEALSRAEYVAQRVFLDQQFASLDVTVIDPLSAFCPDTRCRTRDGQGALLYLDDNHLTARGTKRLLPLLPRALPPAEQTAAR